MDTVDGEIGLENSRHNGLCYDEFCVCCFEVDWGKASIGTGCLWSIRVHAIFAKRSGIQQSVGLQHASETFVFTTMTEKRH